MTPEVAQAFKALPREAQPGLIRLRALIYDCAAGLSETGGVQEVLRWGQPAYLPVKPRVGSTLRLGVPKSGGFALYAHCGTSIIRDFAETYPGLDRIEGNRAVHFDRADQIDPSRHGQLIHHALTYHLRR
ncbi:DUF1801 domain-containing protein [Aestuariivita sp.]|jgi:hypothetical protein|uniref:DUF1801 domain-containing protein n=1 Tax=Aestuariivita sp. TaxID=1872407 RepID=UPI00216F03C9|nr:DUF1801 domain-containing protein [Aestuariivita sp.]MCE8009720.1 DUF1801 domain-containing protein [Aestuariivita sp.]